MCALELQENVADFERLFQAFEEEFLPSTKQFEGDTHIAYTLCQLFAMMTAFRIRTCLRLSIEVDTESATDAEIEATPEDMGCRPGERRTLPKSETVHAATKELFAAVAKEDPAGIFSALERMGVLALCPKPEQQFSRLEHTAAWLGGRAKMVALVELSIFAAELGDYERAGKYAIEARAFDPISYELYNLRIVEGLIALEAGRTDAAIQALAASIDACMTNEYACLECGIRAPNLELASKLLERGEREEVLKHLLSCKDVWDILGPQIDQWISRVESGVLLDFTGFDIVRGMTQPAYKLGWQWDRARLPDDEERASNPPMSVSEVRAASDALRANYKAFYNSAIKGELGTSNN
jgi:tetratricopeptide (TPR) repeat protein